MEKQPENGNDGIIIGIDLGTTNSAAAVWRNDGVALIPNALGDYLTPSVVGLNDDGELLVGRAARERAALHPHQTILAFKRYMGTDKIFKLNGIEYRPEMVGALILDAIKRDAEAYLQEPVSEVIITVPAYFNDVQRKATRMAGQLAGLKVRRLVNEPTAAALAYQGVDESKEGEFLVFDLGGGTFDVSIVEMFDGVVDVCASCGDNFLGGEDFVSTLEAAFIRENKLEKLNTEEAAMVRTRLEQAKRDLSDAQQVTVECTLRGERINWSLSRSKFQSLAAPLLERIKLPLQRAVRDARIDPTKLDGIVPAGGATRMPMIREMIVRLFGRFPLAGVDPDLAVAHGAGVLSGMVMKSQALKERVLADVCPYSLGTEVARSLGRNIVKSGFFLPIIERNTPVPVSREEVLSTIHDGQTKVVVDIYQGEERKTADNIKLAEFELDVPPGPAGKESLTLRFTYDVNGLLEVDATVTSTGLTRRILIERHEGLMSPEELETARRKLQALKVHPRETLAVQATVNRANRLYVELIRDQRAYLDQHMVVFESVLESQDPKACEEARLKLEEVLDELER